MKKMILYSIYFYYGALSPGWKTLKAYTSGERDSLVLWLKYWVIYSLHQGLECLTDFLFDGMLPYRSLKLILSALLVISSPHGTHYIYNVIAKLVSLIGDRWYMYIYRSFWSADQEDNHVEQRGEPPLNGELLKQELDQLMTEIAGGEPNNQDARIQEILNNPELSLESLEPQAIQQILCYLEQRYPDEQPEDE